MTTLTIHEEKELESVARAILAGVVSKDHAHVLAIRGDLGVGKTAFTKAIARVLGIPGEITSPTFVIMKTYSVPQHSFLKLLTHIDAYRIEGDDEMRVLGFTELLADPTRLVVVEWPERIKNGIPEDAHNISMIISKGSERIITYGN